tara:strand:+ start:928 stop:1098 length:171 start_codon:yes stop_codon:yes gene_type:complete
MKKKGTLKKGASRDTFFFLTIISIFFFIYNHGLVFPPGGQGTPAGKRGLNVIINGI